MYSFPKIMPTVAAVLMVAAAQDPVDVPVLLDHALERLAADGVWGNADRWVPPDTRRRMQIIRSHAELVKEGKETLKDYAWLPELLRCYYDCADDKEPPLELVQQLLAAGADVNARDARGRTAIFYHCYSAEVAKALIDAGADVNVVANGGRTPIFSALKKEGLPVLELLKAAGADLNAQDDTGATPLFDNICCGAADVSHWLIAAGADVNKRNRVGKSPVDLALAENAPDLIIEMLHAGAQVDRSKYSPLFLACFHGQLEECRRLVAEGADVNEVFADGITPLMLAARGGHVELCRLLMEAGADMAAESDSGDTALHTAACENLPSACETLIAAGMEVDIRNEMGLTPLAQALRNGCEETVDALLARGAKVNIMCKVEPLIFAALSEDDTHCTMLKKLLAAGADVNMKARGSGMTLLHAAASRGLEQQLGYLISAGMDVNATDASGKTPLAYAVRGGYVGVCRKLLAAGADANAGRNTGVKLLCVIPMAQENTELFDVLLSAGLKVDDENHWGSALFRNAVNCRCVEVCRKLVDAGLQPYGWTPLCLATLFGDEDAVRKLLDEGASPAEKSNYVSPLQLAAYLGHVQLCRLFIERGAGVDEAVTQTNWPPILAAIEGAHADVVKLLLEHGAKVDITTTDGHSLLYRAAVVNSVEICRLLLAAGADANVATKKNKRMALHAAAAQKNEPLCRLLLAHGADVNVQDLDGNTPLHLLLSADSKMRLSQSLCRFLVENGAMLNLKNNAGLTPKAMDATKIRQRYFSESARPMPMR